MAQFDVMAQVRMQVGRGRPGVFAQHHPASADLFSALAVEAAPCSVGTLAVDAETPHDILDMLDGISAPVLLTDFDVLFHPSMKTDVPALLRQLARRRPVFAAWPGTLADTRLVYSVPGRADHIDEPARGFVILHPRPVVFPDEVPFSMEIA